MLFSTEWAASWALTRLFIPFVCTSLRDWEGTLLPGESELQALWVYRSINNSTRGLAKGGLSVQATTEVLSMLANMCPGREASHLVALFNILDLRGSDVRLESGTVLEGGRQLVPYPAIAWDWKCTQSYRWQSEQHINVLELLAFFNYLRAWSVREDAHALRFFHVPDSRVSSCVIAKGRSSSKLLNRILRWICSLLIAADLCVLPLWTFPSWNFSDHGSRAVSSTASNHAG